MLYLFNSAGDKEYVKNVLNTMHLPNGCKNLYQYSINKNNDFKNNSYVQHELVNKCVIKKEIKKLKSSKALIIFIDKSKNPYEFIPLRWATLESVNIRNDRMYFNVVLGELCHVNNLESFNADLYRKCSNLLFLPEKKSNETESLKKHKGFLAFENSEINNELISNDDSWKQTIKLLSEIEIFKNSNCLFSKIELFEANRKKPLKLNKKGKFKLKNKKEYRLDFSYYFKYGNDKSSVIKIDCGDSINYIDKNEKGIQLTEGIASFNICTNNRTRNMSLSFSVDNPNETVITANKSIFCTISLSWWKWILISILLLIAGLTMGGELSRTDNGDIEWNNFIINSVIKAISAVAIWLAGVLYSKKN